MRRGDLLHHGWRRKAHAIARDVRRGLGVAAHAPLEPRRLAASLGIEIIPVSSLTLSPRTAAYVRGDPAAFSAATIVDGPCRAILHNDAHDPARQNSNIAHELAHVLLNHPARPALSAHGCRTWDARLETEADWLAGALLVPEEAALAIARSGWSLAEAAARYGVSVPMMRFRLNVTGAVKRARAPSCGLARAATSPR